MIQKTEEANFVRERFSFKSPLSKDKEVERSKLKVGDRVKIVEITSNCIEPDSTIMIGKKGYLDSTNWPIEEDNPDLIVINDFALRLKDFEVVLI